MAIFAIYTKFLGCIIFLARESKPKPLFTTIASWGRGGPDPIDFTLKFQDSQMSHDHETRPDILSITHMLRGTIAYLPYIKTHEFKPFMLLNIPYLRRMFLVGY